MWLEVEAKLSERPYHDPSLSRPLPFGINPHHLTNARRRLSDEHRVEEIERRTRGGRAISVLMPSDRYGRETNCVRAAARKRLLQARYRGWSDPLSGKPSVIGEAGERVTRASLVAAAPQLDPTRATYLLTPSREGRIANLFGRPVPGGPLDDAADLLIRNAQGTPVLVTVLIEVKNIRHWIYPRAWELHQLLNKAARLQAENPERSLLPVLVCRRAHYNTTMMAKDLGFVVLETIVQPILPHSDIDPDALEEVRAELGYDLLRTDDPLPALVGGFRDRIPAYALRYARQWARTAPVLGPYYGRLRPASLSPHCRGATLDDLKRAAEKLPGVGGPWLGGS